MRHVLTLAFAGLTLMACTTTPVPSQAAEPTVLVMGEDWDKDTIPCKTRVFERVIDALSNQLTADGFRVVNETMASQANFTQDCARRTDGELYKVAKAIRTPPIDAVVSFKIYPRFKPGNATTWMNALVTGRLLNTSTNESLGSFEVNLPEDVATEPGCHQNRECALEYMGRQARILGQDLGAALAAKLRRATFAAAAPAGAPSGAPVTSGGQPEGLVRAYKLTFDGFGPEEVNDIESYLVAFGGYKHHRALQVGARYAEFWYETTAEDAKLKRDLRRMLDFVGVQGQVSCVNVTCVTKKI